MDQAGSTQVDWGLIAMLVMSGGGLIFSFATWRGKTDAQSTNVAAILSTKADQSEVDALDKRIDGLDRAHREFAADIKVALEKWVAQIREDLAAEHTRRTSEHTENQQTLKVLSVDYAVLRQRVEVLERAIERRAPKESSG